MTPVSTFVLIASLLCAREYDPLARSEAPIRHLDLSVRADRGQRSLPVRVYLPSARDPAPVVLFSHGLGGSSRNNPYLGEHWASRGFVAVFMQHPGSDESVWRHVPVAQRMNALRRAASGANLVHRLKDVPAVIDELERWNTEQGHELHGRLDLTRLGMSGHSFGALTTQMVSGQTNLLGPSATDPRIRAAVIMSPSSPRGAGAGEGALRRSFGRVRTPWLLMTGTLDEAPIGDQTVEARLAVFPALPPGDKYELVLWKAEHNAFGDRALPGEREARHPNHHRVILALSSAFWDAYLRNDPCAKAWLRSESFEFGPRSLLEPQDRWQHK